MIWKLCVALRLGVALSATLTVNKLVVLASVTRGRQLKTALLLLFFVSVAFAGALSRLKVSTEGGEAESLALAFVTTYWPGLTVWSGMDAREGAVLAGRKVELTLSTTEVLRNPLSLEQTTRPT